MSCSYDWHSGYGDYIDISTVGMHREERLRSRGSCEVRPFSLFLFLVSARKEGEDEEN